MSGIFVESSVATDYYLAGSSKKKFWYQTQMLSVLFWMSNGCPMDVQWMSSGLPKYISRTA
jgi:hypothetical protein